MAGGICLYGNTPYKLCKSVYILVSNIVFVMLMVNVVVCVFVCESQRKIARVRERAGETVRGCVRVRGGVCVRERVCVCEGERAGPLMRLLQDLLILR